MSTGAAVLVPLYAAPGQEWDQVVQAKVNHPQTGVEAILNASNGPGSSMDANYDKSVRALKTAGVVVLGYVDTARGTRPAGDAETDIAAWQSFYAVDGVFLDNMPRTSGSEGYYKTLTLYAKSIGLRIVVGDPGGDPPQTYVGTVDTLVIYEADGMPPASALGGWHASYDRSNFAYVALSVASLDVAAVQASRTSVGTLYVTAYAAPQAFYFVPPYLDDLVGVAGN